MGIDEITEKSTIEFPKPISLDEAERLVFYIAENLPGEVHYNVHQHKSITLDPEEEDVHRRSESTAGLRGSLRSLKTLLAFDAFSFDYYYHDSSKLRAINFQMVPGWELQDYSLKVRQLWDDTRGVVERYFETESVATD